MSLVVSKLRETSKGQLSYGSILNSDVSVSEKKKFLDELSLPPPFSPEVESFIQQTKRLSLGGHVHTHTPHTPSPLHTPLVSTSQHATTSSRHTQQSTPSHPTSSHPTPSHPTPSSHNHSKGYSLNFDDSDCEEGDFPDTNGHEQVREDSLVEMHRSELDDLKLEMKEEIDFIDDRLLQERLTNMSLWRDRIRAEQERIRQAAAEAMKKAEREAQEKRYWEHQEKLKREEDDDRELTKKMEELMEEYSSKAEEMEAKLKSGEEEKKRIEKMKEEKRRKQLEKLMMECQELLDRVAQNGTKFATLYQSCTHTQFLAQTAKDKFRAGLSILKSIEQQLLKERQSGAPDPTNVSQFHDELNGMESLFADLKGSVEEANRHGDREAKKQQKQQSLLEEAAKKLEAEKLAKEKQAKEAEKKKKEEEKKQSDSGLSISKSMLQPFSSLQDMLAQALDSYKSLVTTSDSSLKKYRFDLQKAITGSINQVSSNSGQDLLQKIYTLKDLLSGKSIRVGTKSVDIGGHPDAKAYCFNLLAAKLVKQGEDQVASSSQAAFPLAALAVGIWTEFEDVGHYILAHFYSVCPVLVPMYVTRTKNMSEADYLKSLGYIVSSDGKVESQDLFLNRVRGTVRLYAAIIQTPQLPTSHMPRPHPHGLEYGWAWLARMLNVDPHPVVTAAALGDFLEIAGHSLMKKYTKQFQKLLYSLWKEYIPKIEKVTPQADRGPLARLTQFLEDCIAAGKIPEPKGCLTEQFWRARSTGIQTA